MDVAGQQRQMARRSGSGGGGVSNDDNSSNSTTTGTSSRSLNNNLSTIIPSPRPASSFLRRRRSRSVDEGVLSQNQVRKHHGHGHHHYHYPRHRLLEDHYRVDRSTNNPRKLIVLPGVPRHEEDWARDSHDFFNLVVLIPVVVLNVMNWNWETIFATAPYLNLQAAWTGDWFTWFFGVTLLYFMVDLLWILTVPSCVKSPTTIVQHHLATILYILIPYYRPAYQWCMGACMIVEVNTWFLIARRVFNKQGFPPWILNLSFVSIRVKLISILFYLTWISIRCILYPYLMIHFTRGWLEHSERVGTKWNVLLLSVPLHAAFCLLNMRWSYDLLMSKIRYWRRKGKGQSFDKGL